MFYRLLAMDMDGTVLSSEKIITPHTVQAIRRALKEGKEVLFATGRCPSEMWEHLALFPEMRYAICLSGATVLDLQEKKDLSVAAIPRDVVDQIMAMAEGVEVAVMVYAGEDVFVEKSKRGRFEYYNCQCFARLYEQCGIWVDDISEAIALRGDDVRKINFYFHSAEEWAAAKERLNALPVTYASGIPLNCEISPAGVDKGVGLTALCAALNIPIDEAIAVGDEGNDLPMVRCAGLGVAMGNATAAVKEAAKAVTADCDHDGVAEVIERYLL